MNRRRLARRQCVAGVADGEYRDLPLDHRRIGDGEFQSPRLFRRRLALDEGRDLFLDLRLGGEQQFRGLDRTCRIQSAQDLRAGAIAEVPAMIDRRWRRLVLGDMQRFGCNADGDQEFGQIDRLAFGGQQLGRRTGTRGGDESLQNDDAAIRQRQFKISIDLMTGELRQLDGKLHGGAGLDLDDHPFAGLRQHR